MDVVTMGPFRSASLFWRLRAGGWVQTVVCKATFVLSPTECVLADVPDSPNEEDDYWDDDAARSLRAPTDLVPFKPCADVLLTGSAFAPRGEPVRSLSARLLVGDVDKSIEVWCDRTFTLDGQLLEGSRVKHMRLRYERAAGGPDTRNPVGIARDGPADMYGRRMVPNLQPPGIVIGSPADFIEPIGFGPIAPDWPDRRNRLGPLAGVWPSPGWTERSMPAGFDPRYFNAAPIDQQVDVIRANERIILENLHREHAHLLTSLPGIAPSMRLARAGVAPEPVEMRADTLYIDTDRGVCTVTWRVQIQLAAKDEQGVVVIDTQQRGAAGGESGEVITTIATQPIGRRGPVLPFVPAADSASHELLEELGTDDMQEVPEGGTLGPGVGQARGQALPFQAATPTAQPFVPAAQATPWPGGPSVPPSAPISEVIPAAGTAPQADGATARAAAPSSVLGASNAAAQAGSEPAGDRAKAGRPRAHESETPQGRPAPSVSERLKLIWCEPGCVSRLRHKPAFRRIITELDLSPPDDPAAAALLDEEPPEAQDRRRVHEVLVRGNVLSGAGLQQAWETAVQAGTRFEPPIVLVTGEIAFPFDELEMLKATVTLVAPFVGGDKKLKEALDTANELLKTPWLKGSGDIAGNLVERLREAFARTRHGLPADYLETHTERMLLQERRYQKRAVYGQTSIRSLLSLPEPASGAFGQGSAVQRPSAVPPPVPAYLPEALDKILPMFHRFKARLLAEADVREDQYESCPMALRVLALGRLLDGL